jgi:hydrogenase nickel incorporation protein HypA/HybF
MRMHEASLMKGLIRRVLEVAQSRNASRVEAVHVRLGALSHMSEPHFREHYAVAAAGTLAEGARIHAIVETDIRSPDAGEVILESIEVS